MINNIKNKHLSPFKNMELGNNAIRQIEDFIITDVACKK